MALTRSSTSTRWSSGSGRSRPLASRDHDDRHLDGDGGAPPRTGPSRAGPAEAAGVGHLVLTHLIPPPADEASEQAFADDVRQGGYTGPLTVGHDLFTIEIA